MTEENEISYPSIKQAWGIVGIAVLCMIVISPVVPMLDLMFGKELSFLVYYIMSMGATFAFAHFRRRDFTGIDRYNFELSSPKVMMLASVAVVGLQIGIVSPLINVIPMPQFMEEIVLDLAKRNGVFSFIAIVVAAPVFEEMIFRGVILDGLLKKYSPTKAILTSSALFGILHLNPWQFIAAMVVGVLSGWVYYETRKLTLCILIHAVNNLVAFVSMALSDPEIAMDQSLTEMYGGYLNLVMITIGAIGVAASCLYLLNMEVKSGRDVHAE